MFMTQIQTYPYCYGHKMNSWVDGIHHILTFIVPRTMVYANTLNTRHYFIVNILFAKYFLTSFTAQHQISADTPTKQ